ncbi:hypothetical protein Taro_042319 [Colocasia esculenta]|uniref:Longin domain-containing protein n=1 Tax=Colocasia esculenta TaxID=4460 RepID=A0A843WSH1_COLES|nr:hypothetical protein [Colocasia esculenta]
MELSLRVAPYSPPLGSLSLHRRTSASAFPYTGGRLRVACGRRLRLPFPAPDDDSGGRLPCAATSLDGHDVPPVAAAAARCSISPLLDRSGKEEKGQGTTPPPLPFWPCLHLWKESSVLEVPISFANRIPFPDEASGRSIPFVFLDRVKDDFMQRYGASIDAGGCHPLADEDEDEDDDLFEDRFSIAYNLDREFGPRLKEHMNYCVSHPEEMSKLSKLKAQITEVKGIMMDNIEKVQLHFKSQVGDHD